METNSKIIEEGLNQIIEIAKERSLMLEQLKEALLEDNDQKIKEYAKKLCGVTK